MKNFLTPLILLVLLASEKAYAQKIKAPSNSGQKIDSIQIDFSKLKDGSWKNALPDTLAYGGKYIIKIDNINRHLFKVDGTVGQKDFNVDLPSIFGTIKLPGFMTFELPSISPASHFSTIRGTEKMASDSVVIKFAEIKSPLSIIEENYLYLQKVARLSNTIKALQMDCGHGYAAIERMLRDSTNKALSLKDGTSRSEQIEVLGNNSLARIEKARKAGQMLEGLQEELLMKIQAKIDTNDKIIQRWVLSPLKPQSNNFKNESEKYIQAQLDKKEGERRIADVNSTIQRALKMVEELEKIEADNKIQLLVDSYKRINPSNFTYVSDPIKISKDETELKFVFKADTLLTCNYPNKLTMQEDIPTVGGWKVDFSTGVFFSGGLGGKGFFGQEVYYLASSDDSTKTIIREKDAGGRLLMSLGALAHIYKRSINNTKLVISPGVSTTTAFDSFMFHLGLSAIFGRKDRFVITLGTTLKESTILDKRYEVDTPYSTKELPKEVPTIKVFPRGGWFLSLTYNLSSLKKNS
ncbi:hypothetical protein [Telluribacter sp. SYSU D00476]|uniref:hypothetical protein n=1 Tax=Telluribacter sp. SYSU D00476 TaxID=2811430 RepID=UPI001FF20BD5|nr:hypothetical protein [Telluribacter sp. SYSU D00476]